MQKTLKQLLKDRGVTQAELAKLLGRDRSVITHMFQGKRQLKAEEARKIADFLDISVAELLGETQLGMSDSGNFLRFEGTPSKAALQSGQVKRDGDGYIVRDASTSGQEYALEMPDESLNLAGILKGDILVADMRKQPEEGQLAVLQHYMHGDAQTLVRRYQPPFLTGHSTESVSPLPVDDDSVRIVCAVTRLLRKLV